MPMTLDGEFGGTHTKAHIEVVETPVTIIYGK